MINFKFNPEYVPGGVHNFWVRDQTGDANGMAVKDSAVTSGNNQPQNSSVMSSSMFGSGFFTNSTAATAVASKKEEDSVFIKTKTAAKECVFPAGGWKFNEPSDILFS